MIHPIVKYGDPVLETPTKRVEKFDADFQKLVDDMFESMYAANGVGLAAPQIGLSMRVTVIDVSNGKNAEAKLVCANPEIIHAEGEQREEEGCLSVPGFRAHVARPQYVTIRAHDAAGKEFEMRGEPFSLEWITGGVEVADHFAEIVTGEVRQHVQIVSNQHC